MSIATKCICPMNMGFCDLSKDWCRQRMSAPAPSSAIPQREDGPDLADAVEWMRQAASRNFRNSEGGVDVNYYEGYLAALSDLEKEMDLMAAPPTLPIEGEPEANKSPFAAHIENERKLSAPEPEAKYETPVEYIQRMQAGAGENHKPEDPLKIAGLERDNASLVAEVDQYHEVLEMLFESYSDEWTNYQRDLTRKTLGRSPSPEALESAARSKHSLSEATKNQEVAERTLMKWAWANRVGTFQDGAKHVFETMLKPEVAELQAQINNYKIWLANHEEVHKSHRGWVRHIDVMLNGEEGATPQASLIDKWKTYCKTIPLLPDLDFYEDEDGLSAGQISWLIAEQEKMLEEPLIDALKRIMYDFIDTLPKKQRRVIELTALGCGGHKIAEILGINYQTAINSRNRAIKSMYQTLPETSRHRLKIGIK